MAETLDFNDIYARTVALRADLCAQCKTADDLIMVGTAFAFEAARIWEELGGPAHAAAQLYASADQMAAKTTKGE